MSFPQWRRQVDVWRVLPVRADGPIAIEGENQANHDDLEPTVTASKLGYVAVQFMRPSYVYLLTDVLIQTDRRRGVPSKPKEPTSE